MKTFCESQILTYELERFPVSSQCHNICFHSGLASIVAHKHNLYVILVEYMSTLDI